jgi:hypothetical protein
MLATPLMAYSWPSTTPPAASAASVRQCLPATPIDFQPHVTIVHPSTSEHGEQAWNELAGMHLDARFTITDVAITAYDGLRWPTLQTIPLTGQPPD